MKDLLEARCYIPFEVYTAHKEKVITFCHKNNFRDNNVSDYQYKLGKEIELHKYYHSKSLGYDVGLKNTIIDYFEKGFYKKLLESLPFKLGNMEKIIEVIGNSESSHVMPRECFQEFKGNEQLGLMFTIFYQSLLRANHKYEKERMIQDWILKKKERKSKIFSETFKRCEVRPFSGEYTQCRVFHDLYKTILKNFNLDEKKVERINPEFLNFRLRFASTPASTYAPILAQ